MEQQLIPLEQQVRWQEALDNVPHAFAHTWDNCYAMYLTTGFPTFLYCMEVGDVKIVSPIAERSYLGHTDIVTPYGFSGFVGNNECECFPVYWEKFVQEHNYVCGYIGLNPLFCYDTYYNYTDVYTYNTLYVLHLDIPIQELYRNLHQNRKRQLKHYADLEKSFIVNEPILKDFFIQNYYTFFSQRNASQVYSFSNETLLYLINSESVLLVGVYLNNKVEAVSVYAHTPYGAEYLFNISLPEGQQHTVPLLWFGINYYKSLKIPNFNLGGGVKEGDSIAQFKKRFGAAEYQLMSLKQVYNNQKYNELCKKANLNPDEMEGYFPAYRQPKTMSIN